MNGGSKRRCRSHVRGWESYGPLGLFAILGFLCATSSAQTRYSPPLWEALPLEESPQGVHLRYPAALDTGFVCTPNQSWRLLHRFFLPGGTQPEGIFSRGDASRAFSRSGAFSSIGEIPAGRGAGARLELHRVQWKHVLLFRQALYAMESGETCVLLEDPQTHSLLDQPLDPPYGMLLLQDTGPGILVAALRSGSPAEKAGVRPKDRIMSCQGRAVAGLAELLTALKEAKEEVRRTKQPGIPMELLRPESRGGQRRVTVALPLPPSLESDLWRP
jgi:hypothetical protein